jgi:hypothetical protein
MGHVGDDVFDFGGRGIFREGDTPVSSLPSGDPSPDRI